MPPKPKTVLTPTDLREIVRLVEIAAKDISCTAELCPSEGLAVTNYDQMKRALRYLQNFNHALKVAMINPGH